MVTFLSRKIKLNPATSFVMAVIVILLLFNIAFAPPSGGVAGDAASLVLTATAPFTGLGIPFKDFWDYKPPGALLLIGLWTKIFNYSQFSFPLLQLLTNMFSGLLFYFILKKIFPLRLSILISLLAFLLFYSPYFNLSLIPAELFGLFFSLAGLTCLLYVKRIGLRFFTAALFLTLAGQMKDPFGFVPLTLLPPLIFSMISRESKNLLKPLVFSALGVISVGVMSIGYLLFLGAFENYLELLHVKSVYFDINMLTNWATFSRAMSYTVWYTRNIFFWIQPPIYIIGLIWGGSLVIHLIRNKTHIFLLNLKCRVSYYSGNIQLKVIRPRMTTKVKSIYVLTVAAYSISSFIGFSIQGKFDAHHLLQILFPAYFLLAIALHSSFNNLVGHQKFYEKNIFLWIILIALLFPKIFYIQGYSLRGESLLNVPVAAYKNFFAHSKFTLENYIASKTKGEDCILSVYGWSVGTQYYYAHRRPCSRFFLVNATNLDWQMKEFRESLLQHPPQAIFYTLDGADMDPLPFEKEVFNISQVIKNCYKPDLQFYDPSPMGRNLYFPAYQGKVLKDCVIENAL